MNIQLLWNRRYVIRSYVNSALWVVPFIAVVVEQLLVRVAGVLREWLIASGTIDRTSLISNVSAAGALGVQAMSEESP